MSNSAASVREDIQRTLGRIEGKLDALVDVVDAHVKDDKFSFSSLGSRVSTIERKFYVGGGIFLAAWSAITLFKDKLGTLFG